MRRVSTKNGISAWWSTITVCSLCQPNSSKPGLSKSNDGRGLTAKCSNANKTAPTKSSMSKRPRSSSDRLVKKRSENAGMKGFNAAGARSPMAFKIDTRCASVVTMGSDLQINRLLGHDGLRLFSTISYKSVDNFMTASDSSAACIAVA